MKKLNIECEQLVKYNQEVFVNDEEYDLLMKFENGETTKDENGQIQDLIRHLLDSWDVYDSNDYEDIMITSVENEETD